MFSHLRCASVGLIQYWSEGDADKKLDQRWSGLEVRMHGRETVEAFLAARARGLSVLEAAREAGVAPGTAFGWDAGVLPRSYAGVPAKRPPRRVRMARMAAAIAREAPLDESERAAYDAAMEENVLPGAVLDDLKWGGSHPGSMSNRRKCELGERSGRETGLPLRSITAFLRISKSSYEYHRARLGRDRDAGIRGLAREAFEASGHSRGYREVHARLRRAGVAVNEKRVRRVMREEGLRPAYARRRRRGRGSYEGEVSAAPPNLVNRDFRASAPDELWPADVTEFRLPSGEKVYLSPVIDCFDGRPAAWSIGRHPSKGLANPSLEKALAQRLPGRRTTIHSDRGGHYRWPEWIAICDENGLVRSMSAKGCSPDNAACEGFFDRLKNEFFHHRDWSGVTPEEFMRRLDGYLRYYCEGRMKGSLGWLSPMEYRRRLGYAV